MEPVSRMSENHGVLTMAPELRFRGPLGLPLRPGQSRSAWKTMAGILVGSLGTRLAREQVFFLFLPICPP